MLTSMSRKEAIKKMGCRERECEYFDPEGIYSFCRVLFTDEMCLKKDKMKKSITDKMKEIMKEDIRMFYFLAKKHGFCYMNVSENPMACLGDE